jgi:RNA polymerase sigma factor (sigma-70 family)
MAMDEGRSPSSPGDRARRLDEDSLLLIERAREGDGRALEELCRRYLPRLRHWASGRLPARSRGMLETLDLVDEAVMATLSRIGTLDLRQEGALLAYLRQVVLNRIRDEGRRQQRRPEPVEMPADLRDAGPSPLEELVGRETLERYEDALTRLRPGDREAIVGWVELGYSLAELQQLLGKPSPDAARMTLSRALARLAEEMGYGS